MGGAAESRNHRSRYLVLGRHKGPYGNPLHGLWGPGRVEPAAGAMHSRADPFSAQCNLRS
eukprot:5997429-Pyramimonas_sp.AAC.1